MSASLKMEEKVSDYIELRAEYRNAVEEIRAEIRHVKRKHKAELLHRKQMMDLAERELAEEIRANPELFKNPKTRTFDGLRYGMQKKPGRVEARDKDVTIGLIRKRLPHMADVLIAVKESLNLAQIKALPARDLAACGIAVIDPYEDVLIKSAPDDLDRYANSLTNELAQED